jgi:hypothetical protein
MKTLNLERHEELGDFLYHVREILELQNRLSALIEQLDASFDKDSEGTETVMGKLEAELYFHLPYHLRELREPFERILKELYGEDTRILVDQDGD